SQQNPAAPPIVYLPVSPLTPTPFHGEIDEDVKNCMKHYGRAARHNGWTDEQYLHNLYFMLKSAARHLLENREASLTSLDISVAEYPRRQEKQAQCVRPERLSPRKTDMWRTADGRPPCTTKNDPRPGPWDAHEIEWQKTVDVEGTRWCGHWSKLRVLIEENAVYGVQTLLMTYRHRGTPEACIDPGAIRIDVSRADSEPMPVASLGRLPDFRVASIDGCFLGNKRHADKGATAKKFSHLMERSPDSRKSADQESKRNSDCPDRVFGTNLGTESPKEFKDRDRKVNAETSKPNDWHTSSCHPRSLDEDKARDEQIERKRSRKEKRPAIYSGRSDEEDHRNLNKCKCHKKRRSWRLGNGNHRDIHAKKRSTHNESHNKEPRNTYETWPDKERTSNQGHPEKSSRSRSGNSEVEKTNAAMTWLSRKMFHGPPIDSGFEIKGPSGSPDGGLLVKSSVSFQKVVFLRHELRSYPCPES
ncbi:hypothetical protein HPB47_005566, partial [Ixodes persulcatus]